MEENNNQTINNNHKMNNKILAIILSIIVFLIGGFLIYDKVINKETSNLTKDSNSSSSDFESSNENQASAKENGLVEIDLSNQLLNNLKYPRYNSNKGTLDGFSLAWEYIDIDVNTLDRSLKMLSASEFASEIIRPSEDCNSDYCSYVAASEMKKGFIKLFGPDAQYQDGPLAEEYANDCGALGIYDSNKKIYHDIGTCGIEGEPDSWFTNNKAYKAEMDENNIFVYYHFVYIIGSYVNENYYFNSLPVYNIDYKINPETYEIENASKSIYKGSDINKDFDKLISENKLKTYKYTFKKQSDGNYYFYSGKIQ